MIRVSVRLIWEVAVTSWQKDSNGFMLGGKIDKMTKRKENKKNNTKGKENINRGQAVWVPIPVRKRRASRAPI